MERHARRRRAARCLACQATRRKPARSPPAKAWRVASRPPASPLREPATTRVQSTNATISQIGPVTPTLDPIIQESSTFSHTTALYPDAQASATATLVDATRAHTVSIQQGFLTGGSATLTYTDHYLDQNSPNDVLNPTSAPLLSIAAQQYLLNGAGVAVNARFINVAKMNRDSSNLAFQNTVIGIVAQVLNAYYTLEADYEDVKAKRSASETAVTFSPM